MGWWDEGDRERELPKLRMFEKAMCKCITLSIKLKILTESVCV